nr:cyclic nucleotide-binding domain-containing protein [Salsipaludibacter albus]
MFARLGDDVAVRDVAVGDTLTCHGEAVDGLYRVVSGHLEATVEGRGGGLRVGGLGPGDLVGEISLLAGGVSTATVTATEPVRVAFVPAAVAHAALDAHPELAARLAEGAAERVDRNALVSVLTEFTDLSEMTQLAPAVAELGLRRLPSGEVLLCQGDVAESAFLVVSGRLAVTVRDEHGEQTEVARLGRGQVVGEGALFEREARSATVVAVRDSVVAELRAETFHAMLARNPVTMARITRQLVERMARPPRGQRRVVSTVAVVTTNPAVNARVVTTQVTEALGRFGTVAHVTAARVDADLGVRGIAASEPSEPGSRRVAAHLHEVELTHDFTVLEVDRGADAWARAALGTADRVLLVVSPTPDRDERDAVAAATDRIATATRTNAVVVHPVDTAQPRGTAALRDVLGVDRVLHARAGRREDLDRAARITAGRAVGLALGGGGARGFAHVGVQRVLAERGVPIDVLAGSSIGAPIAGGMACGVPPEDFGPALHRLFAGLLDYTVPVVSLVKGERITRSIQEQFDGWDFEDTWKPFLCVSTNLTRSRTRVHRSGPTAPAVRASVAIPGVLPPVPDGADLLVDGGVLNNLPVDVLADEGICGTIIAVDVAPPVGPRARSDYGLSVSGWQALRATVGRGRSGYPGIASVLMRSMLVGSQRDRTRVLDEAAVDLVLELDLRGVGLLEFDVIDPVIARGAELAGPLVDDWLASGGWTGRAPTVAGPSTASSDADDAG